MLAALTLASGCAHNAAPVPAAGAANEIVNVFDAEGRVAAAYNMRTSQVTLYQSPEAATRALFDALIRTAQQAQVAAAPKKETKKAEAPKGKK